MQLMLLLLLSLWRVDIDNDCVTKFQRLPEIRKGIMLPDAVLHDTFVIDGKGRELIGVWTWYGIDPGDKLELDLNVYFDNIPVALRSPHKPLSLDYEGWRWFPNYGMKPGPVEKVSVHISANVTGHNTRTPRAEGTDTARVHYGVWGLWECYDKD